MARMVKDFIEIKDYRSLDGLIAQLIAARDSLPPGADPEIMMRGDDIFGRQLAICHFRPQTEEEAECDARYANAYREARQREIERSEVQAQAGGRRRGRLHIVV